MSSTPPVQFTGLGSGIDWQSIVQQLIQLDSQPITQMQQQQGALQAASSAWSTIQSELQAFESAAQALTQSTLFSAVTASSSDTGVLAVSGTNGATPGSYAVQVKALATGPVITGNVNVSKVNPNDTLQNQFGITSSGAWTIVYTDSSGNSTTVSVGYDPNQTLAQVAEAVATRTGGAVQLTLGPNGYMQLVGSATGSQASLALTADTGALAADLGFTAGAPAVYGGDASFVVQGQNAGYPQTSHTNTVTLTGALSGLTMTLTGVGTATITVSANQQPFTDAVNAFVSEYNKLVGLLQKETTLGDPSTTADDGPLANDLAAQGMAFRLRQIVTSAVAGATTYQSLADIGIGTSGTDNQLAVTDSAKLSAALQANPQAVLALLTNGSGTGVVDQLSRYVDSMAGNALGGVSGVIPSIEQSLSDQIRQISDQITAFQSRLDLEQQTLTQQFLAMEAA
ncbi:MAG: flagellar filament capping protein FliD, partial [Firmicutes bacterium]|nr:flagellar filament capping protein FliD [Bacillota bacterium]